MFSYINWRKYEFVFLSMILIMAIFISVFFAASLFTGIHNVDLGFNFLSDDEKVAEVFDLASDGKVHNMYELYSLGLDQIKMGYIFFGLSTFLIGYIIGLLIMCNSKKGDNE